MIARANVILLCLLFAAAPALSDCPPPVPGENAFLRGQIMLRVADDADINDVLDSLNQLYPDTTILRSIEAHSIYTLQVPPEHVDCDVLEDVLNTMVRTGPAPDPNRPLNWAELNYETEAAEGSTGTIYISMVAPDVQALYASQYVTDVIGLPTALTACTGRGTAVAVLDTGVDASHPRLAGHVLPGYNFVARSADTSDVGDGIDSDGDLLTDEMTGHGTYVAGLIHLVAPDAMIVPVVVLDSDGIGQAYEIAQGIYYAIDRGVEVINMSFGSSDESDAVQEALHEARKLGIVVVSAAGNDNRIEPPRFPASSGDLIGVVATDDTDVRAPFSNYNHDLTLAAPGTSTKIGVDEYDPNRSIYSTIPGGHFAVWEGTSMSTALVSGAAALIRGQHPEWPNRTDTAQNVEDALTSTATNIDALNPGYAGMLGAGRLDIAAAVALGPVQPRVGDLDADGVVDLDDLSQLLADYGGVHTSADLNADGIVNLTDLGLLLANYGP